MLCAKPKVYDQAGTQATACLHAVRIYLTSMLLFVHQTPATVSVVIITLVDWFCLVLDIFTSLQHLRSYHDVYRLVRVHTKGEFILLVLPHYWETRPSAP